MTEKKKNGSGGKTRREFLRDAGLLVGGTAIGSTVLLAACGGGETTKTVTTTAGATTVTDTTTVTAGATTLTDTITSTTTVGAGQTATTTATVTESRFICPIDSMEFDTLAELQAHFAAEHPGEKIPGLINLTINGKLHTVKVKNNWTLAYVLREKLGYTGTKRACDSGDCGVCTLIMGGRPVLSCLVLAMAADGMSIETIEGLAKNQKELHPIQKAFVENDAMQCGFCTPAMIMTTKALLEFKSNPTRDEVKEFLAGTFCRCGAHPNIIKAVLAV